MDLLKNYEKMMKELESSESSYFVTPVARLSELCEKVSLALKEGSQEIMENLYALVEQEISHYENLILQALSQIEECGGLPDNVGKITIALTEDIKSGYEHFVSAYCGLAEALFSGDPSKILSAREAGNRGETIISEVQGIIGEIRDEIPVVA